MGPPVARVHGGQEGGREDGCVLRLPEGRVPARRCLQVQPLGESRRLDCPRTAEDWNLKSVLKSLAISLTSLWNGSFLMRRSVDFWNFLISLRATVPGLNLCALLTPPLGDGPLVPM